MSLPASLVRALQLLPEAGKPVVIRALVADRQEARRALAVGMQVAKKAIMACSLEPHYSLAFNHPFPFPYPSWRAAESQACPYPFPWELVAKSLAFPYPS